MAELDRTSQQAVRVLACPHPFTADRIEKRLPQGKRISELMEAFDLVPADVEARVFIDDLLIEKARWHRVIPKAGIRS